MKGLPPARRGFTLIEIMVVISIAAMVLVIGLPSFLRTFKKGPIGQATSDVIEACSFARARAILDGTPAELRIFPKARQFTVSSGPQPGAADLALGGAKLLAGGGDTGEPSPAEPAIYTAQLPAEVEIEMVDVNLREYKDAAETRVWFYPNGTSDELTVVLQWNQTDWRKITLDMVTGLADWEPLK
jgi:prepilin-type N-terminal cleavage/methylation domain-containing protein